MSVRVPPPMDDADAALEANVRTKLARGEPLSADERAFLARLPGERDVPPGDLQ